MHKFLILLAAFVLALVPASVHATGSPSGPNYPFTGCAYSDMVVVEVNLHGVCMPVSPSIVCPPGYVGVNGAPVHTGHDPKPYPVCEPIWNAGG